MASSRQVAKQSGVRGPSTSVSVALLVIAASFWIGSAARSAAQSLDRPYLVRDIASRPADPLFDAELFLAASLGERGLLWVNQTYPGSGISLWSSDGTESGTTALSDLFGHQTPGSISIRSICVGAGRSIFWTGHSGELTSYIWSTDGTNDGTRMIMSLPLGASIGEGAVTRKACEDRELHGRILFWITQWWPLGGPIHELWSTDGSAAGTSRVTELGSAPGLGASGPQDFSRLADRILFSLGTTAHGFQVWRTDGTEAGTEPFLSDLAQTEELFVEKFVPVGDAAYFVGFNWDEASPAPLAVTDGTAAGTRVFPGFWPRQNSQTSGFAPVALADRLVLAATLGGSFQLWGVDSMEASPAALTSYVGVESIRPLLERPVGGRALFVATFPDPPHSWRDRLLLSDGTATGTSEVDVGCGATGLCGIGGLGATGSAGFLIVSTASGISLWRTDGTPLGTTLVAPFDCAIGCQSTFFAAADSKLYFLRGHQPWDQRLWVTDGTAAGTVELLSPEGVDLSSTAQRGSTVLSQGLLLFAASDTEAGLEPWVSDGTPRGTHRITNLASWRDPSEPANFSAKGARLLFSARESVHGSEVWVSEGGAGNTQLLGDLPPGPYESQAQPLPATDEFWPIGADPTSLGEMQSLYYTNGTPGEVYSIGFDAEPIHSSVSFDGRSLITSGSRLLAMEGYPPAVATLAEIGDANGILPFLAVGTDRVYFRNVLAEEPYQLWSTDGTLLGTQPYCAGPDSRGGSTEGWIGELGTGVVFKARTASQGLETYFCHPGETAVLLADIANGPADSDPVGFVRAGAWSLFAATDNSGDRELWRTDGTQAGTSRLADISLFGSSEPLEFEPIANGVLFSADDGQHGRELWFSDGTAAGTALVGDLAPGVISSSPADFERMGDAVVFAAETLASGRELWVTSGTPESTFALPEIRPGPLSSWPAELTATQHRLFFRATDEHGAELWALCPSWVAGSADACNELFSDGFESASTQEWSVPLP